MTVIAPSYTASIFDSKRRLELLKRCVKRVEEIKVDVPDLTAITVCGHSGLLGAMIAAQLNLDLISVRKAGSRGHDNSDVNGPFRGGSYIFVDDLIDSGETLTRSHKLIREACSYAIKLDPSCGAIAPVFAGAFLYRQNIFSWKTGKMTKIYHGNWDDVEGYRSNACKEEIPKLTFWTIEWSDIA